MNLTHSVRLSVRHLLRSPAFAAGAVLTLAIGIGLSTAVFTVANALLLRKLPVQDQERVVTLWGERDDRSVDNWPLDLRRTREFADQTKTLQGVGYFAYEGAWPIAVRTGDQLTRMRRALVSGNFFDVLGTRAMLGRRLEPSDNVVGAAPVVVISHSAWQGRFGGDLQVIGRKLELMEFGTTATVVGVMPPGMEYPQGADFWAAYVPARLRSEQDTTAYTAVDLVGRLSPGATASSAQSELTAFFGRQNGEWSRNLHGVVQLFENVVLGNVRAAIWVFLGASALLLLITCIDVANLLLVRGLGRIREIAVRTALGASKTQVVAQLMMENALLALGSGLLGVAIAAVCVKAFRVFAPGNVPLVETVSLHGGVLAAAVAITTVAALIFGVAPAFATAREDVQEILRSGTRQSASRRSRLVRESLVAAQIALAVLMLSAAALMGRSFMKLRDVDLKFDASHLLVAELAIRYDLYDELPKQVELVRRVLAQLRTTPGVRAVSPVVAMPFSGTGGWTGRAGLIGQSKEQSAKNPMFNMDVVAPDYFTTMGLRVARGRAFAPEDRKGSEPVVVISETTARLYWPDQDPIGQRLFIGENLEDAFTVVGVVEDTRYRDLRTPQPSVYYNFDQSPFPFPPTTFVIRSASSPEVLVPTLRRAIADAAPGVALASGSSFGTYLEGPLSQPRLNAFLLGIFAASAAILAAIGLFGVVATMVRQRSHELGVRMALGATAMDVQSMVLTRGMTIAGVGVAVGTVTALMTNRVLVSLLYDVTPTDPGTLAGVGVFLVVIAAIASLLPARQSARIDPVVALRNDG